MALVQHVLDGIEDDLIRKHVKHGEKAIFEAKPIEPLIYERQTI